MEKRGGLERKEESLTRSRGENHRRRSQEFGELAEAAVDGPEEGTSERAPRSSEARPEMWVCRVPGRTAPGSFSVPENTPCPERMD